MRDRGDRVALRQHPQRVVKAELGAPLREGHPQFAAEEAAQRAFARSGRPPERGQGAGVGRVVVQEVTDRLQARVGGGGELEGLLWGRPQLVEEDGAQAPALGAVVVRATGGGEEQFAQERADGQDGGRFQTERVDPGGQAECVEVQVAVGAVGVDTAGRYPDGAGAGREPGACCRW